MMNIHCVMIHKIHRTILKELNWQGRKIFGGFICPGDVSAAYFHAASILSTVSSGTDFSKFSLVSLYANRNKIWSWFILSFCCWLASVLVSSVSLESLDANDNFLHSSCITMSSWPYATYFRITWKASAMIFK